MTDGYLMEADCIHGEVWFECAACSAEIDLGPRFPECYVPMARYVAVDAWGHLMMEVCAEMRRHGVDEDTIKQYREAALTNEGGPYAETPRWVRVTKERSAA